MRLLQIIDKTFVGRFIARKQELIASLNPDRIYVENIRSFFNISFRFAKLLCELAVRQGFLTRKVGVICENISCQRVILSVDDSAYIPEFVTCQNCELREAPTYVFPKDNLETITYYQLNDAHCG